MCTNWVDPLLKAHSKKQIPSLLTFLQQIKFGHFICRTLKLKLVFKWHKKKKYNTIVYWAIINGQRFVSSFRLFMLRWSVDKNENNRIKFFDKHWRLLKSNQDGFRFGWNKKFKGHLFLCLFNCWWIFKAAAI